MKAHNITDIKLAELEKALQTLYNSTYKDIKKKSQTILNKINTTPSMTAQQRITEYNKYDRLKKLELQLTDSIKNVNKEAVKMINGDMVDVYRVNYNAMASIFPEGVFPVISKSTIRTILTGQVTPFTELAIDDLKNSDLIRRQLTRQLTQGIVEGDSIPNLAKRIKGVLETSMNDSLRIARTETTRIESSARQEVGNQGTNKGFKMQKQWISTSDSRTRPSHGRANGQIVDNDKPFIVGGEELMYPGDANGSAGNIINCRCTMINIIDKGRE